MIELKQAFDLAKSEAMMQYRDVTVTKCVDIGEKYAFTIRSGGNIIVGAPAYTVDKTSGTVGFLSIPPIENLDLLSNGVTVDITNFE